VPGTRLRIEPALDTGMARRFPGGGLVIEVASEAPGHATAAAPAARADAVPAGAAEPHVPLPDGLASAAGSSAKPAPVPPSLRVSAKPSSAWVGGAPAPSAPAHALSAVARQSVPSARWSAVAADEALYDDGRSRAQPYVCVRFDGVEAIDLHYRAELIHDPAMPTAGLPPPMAPVPRLQPPEGAPADTATGLCALAEWLPWLQHNALVHCLSPRGLEQFSGGGWGTRDVCQGPVELMSAHGRHDVVRDLLCRVFSAQNPDGDWPQWFMFFPRDAAVRAGDSHGDIVFWPLLALAEHLAATGDAALLDEPIAYHGKSAEPLQAHVDRAFAVMAQRRIAGTALAAYGHGDWNDALQPADPAMRDQLCSAWTVTLHYKLLRAWGQAWRRLDHPERSAAAEAEAAAVLSDFQRLLVADGVLAGYASFDDPAAPRLLLHPRDRETGIRYSALAMVHAIIDELFTPEQAAAHADLMARELSGPDGLRLFDRPLAYRGGPMKLFQRGESASYFGREIGLMYMHAHLRWAEALAQLGRGDALLHALRLANPIGLQALVPTAAPRQSNCYYSSSDAAFADRHEAAEHYDRIARGEVALEGGWRIYSSGAGIAWRLVVQRLLGLTQQVHRLVIDPVLPPSLDGLQAAVELYGVAVQVSYSVGPRGHGPTVLRLNGQRLPIRLGRNRYRAPGVEVAIEDWRVALFASDNRLEVVLG
jgi:hypothetical protein